MQVCKGAQSLLEVKRNIEAQLANPKLRDLNRSVFTTLDEYFNLILPQMSVITFSRTLDVQSGINIMDLERMSTELQSLVMRSVLETVLKEMRDTIVVIPEAWKFLPQQRGNPCKEKAEEFIRQGATNRNFLWIDSQDVTGVDKGPLKSIGTWILGLQTEMNEVKRTLDQMPVPKKLRPSEEAIMTLPRGHFYYCSSTGSKKVYVQPAWLDENAAKQIAMGTMSVDAVAAPVSASLPPIPRVNVSDVTEERLLVLEDLKREQVAIRRECATQIRDLMDYVTKAMAVVNELATVPRPSVTLTQMQEAPLDYGEIARQVLALLPKGTVAGQTMTVAPLEALKKQFLQEAKERILKAVGELEEKEKNVVKFIEAAGKGITQKDLLDRCLGISGTSGGNQKMIKVMTQRLSSLGFIRRDERIATSYPALREKIKNELGFHQATDQEIDQVYNHIVAELL